MKPLRLFWILTLLSVCAAASADVTVGSSAKGPVKLMNAVNNGPVRSGAEQVRDNFQTYSDCHIPYARTHDSSFLAEYGGEHTVDISAIFPDFSRDVDDPSSYDFANTDVYLSTIRDAGTQVFFRLGQKIEHGRKKYNIYPPADYLKWARICEHIIRHYNQGWADGYEWNIAYWEIWNEPDLDFYNGSYKTDPRTWGGSDKDFFEFYRVVADHLNACFPDLKTGGPALAHDMGWAKRFLEYMRDHKVGLDFFSWHIYDRDPARFAKRCDQVRSMLDEYGYTETESILNEWNYVRNWTDEFQNSIDVLNGLKGAAFAASVLQTCQDHPLDMLMYYDVRPGAWDGFFDFYTYAPKPTYYVFYAWDKLLRMGTQLDVSVDESDVYATAASDGRGRTSILVSRFNDVGDVVARKRVKINAGDLSGLELTAHLTDSYHMYTEVPVHVTDGAIELVLEPDAFAFIELRPSIE